MRGRLVLLAGVLLAVAGCTAGTAGVDGDLTNGWAPPPAPTPWRPESGVCFDGMAAVASLEQYAPIPCAERHIAETYFVGESPAGGSAWAECSRQATAFAGADWHTGRLAIQPVVPARKESRWFRCDMAEQDAEGALAGRSGSLKGSLAGRAPLAQRCFDPRVDGSTVRTMRPVACTRPHHAEFAGLWTAPDVRLDRLADDPRMRRGCLTTIARFAGLPDDGDMRFRVGWLGLAPAPAAWAAGDRAVRCYLWLSEETLRGSMRGAGPGRLPIHFTG